MILLLDDHPMVRKGLISILNTGEQPEEVWEAGTVKKAMDVMATKEIDVALVDLSLSGESGFDFIRKTNGLPNRPGIIVMTSSTSLSDYEQAKALQVDGYLVKDAYVEDILYAVQMVKRGGTFVSPSIRKRAKQRERVNEEETLTQREEEVFQLLKEGKSNAEISDALFITEATTKKHVSNVMAKLKLKRRVEAVLYVNTL